MSELSEYLHKLKFDPNLNKGFFAGMLTNIRVAILMIVLIVVAGIFGIMNLPRRVNPEVNIPIVFVSAILPGASPTDVESLLTEPLEKNIKSVSGITKMTSTSRENMAMIVVEFQSEIDSKQAEADVQSQVNKVTDLPADALEPTVMALDFEDVPVITFSLVSSGDEASLMEFSYQLQKEIENLSSIREVVLSGIEKQEIEILLDSKKITELKLNPMIVQQAVTSSLNKYPAGSVSVNGNRVSVGIEADGDTLSVIRNSPLNINQTQYLLADIASISLKSSALQAKSYYASQSQQSKRAVTFSVFKNTSANLETSASDAKEITQEYLKTHDGQFQMVMLDDFDQEISDQFNQLLKDFSSSILLVFITLLLFLGIRQASIASFAIPVSFFFTFAAMYFMDLQLSFIALFSLLLGLGMIVDDTIVMISAMTDYFSTGKFTPKQTALLVWHDYLIPTLSGNLTNVWSFLPLLLATGIIGEFIDIVAVVVTIALVGSTAIALLVTIPLMMIILKPSIPQRVTYLLLSLFWLLTAGLMVAIFKSNPLLPLILISFIVLSLVSILARSELAVKFNQKIVKKIYQYVSPNFLKRAIYDGYLSSDVFIGRYQKVLTKVLNNKTLKRKVVLAVIVFSIFSYLLVPLGLVKSEFFPKTDQPAVYVGIEFPDSTRLETTQRETEKVLEELRSIDGVDFVLADVGVPVSLNTISSSQVEANLVRFTLRLPDEKKRTRTSIDIASELRNKFQNYPQGDFKVIEESGGPPSGSDLQLTITGEQVSELQKYAESVANHLKQQPGVSNVEVSIKPGASKLVFTPDSKEILQAGLSTDQVGLWSRLYLSGLQLDKVKINDQEYPVNLRFNRGDVPADDLASFSVLNAQGQTFPLLSLGKLSLAQNPTSITHQDSKRSISISASVLPGFNRVDLGKNLEKYAQKDLNLATGYIWSTGGVNEENQKSVNSIFQAMVLSALLILATMVIELGSFRKAIIVMLVIPLAVSGVFIVFAIIGTPLSFPALIGIMALFGIVVKNAIMMIDKINLNLEAGIEFKEAIAEGAASRLEPIMFSSVTNIIGLIPISISDPLWRGLGGAIISGLFFSGSIMLIFIPVIYDWWLGEKSKQSR